MQRVPRALEEWDEATIRWLLDTKCYEDHFDFKEGIPPRDLPDNPKVAIRRTAVALANRGGGFLVFGVKDDRSLPTAARLVGVPPEQDFAKHVADLLGITDPAVPHRVQQPPIALWVSGRLLPVIEILGTSAPHSLNGTFYRRTLKGAEQMTTAEVREMFMDQEGKLSRVRLLLLELTAIDDALTDAMSGTDALRHIDTRLLAELHSSLLPLLSEHPQLSEQLVKLRAFGGAFNARVDMALAYLGTRAGDFGGAGVHIGQVQGSMPGFVRPGQALLRSLRKAVSEAFGIRAPALRGEAGYVGSW